MRFTISAVAATSGLLLMGLAFYGQPALYFHQAREQWDALIDSPAAEQLVPDHDAVADNVVRLQQQVARLEDELAAKRAATVDQPAAPDHDAVADGMVRLQQQVARLEDELAAKQAVAVKPAPPAVVQAAAPPIQPTAPPVQTAAPEAEAPQSAPSGSPAPDVEQPLPRIAAATAGPAPPAGPVSSARSEARAHEAPRPTPEPAQRAFEPESEQVPALADMPKAPPPKLASLKPSPAPPPLPLRQDTDDAQSVLARLRQLAPAPAQQAPAPAQQADLPPPVEHKPRPVQFPSLPKLAAARAALDNGRVDAARRLLQEAQLQLVFRPIGSAGDDLPSAGTGAANVAHALEALSANDVPLSRRYIDIAMNDLSGTGTAVPVQESQIPATGYAPAYPPR